MTNGDKIRQMSNEELAGLFGKKCEWCEERDWCDEESVIKFCVAGIKAYLDMEVEE